MSNALMRLNEKELNRKSDGEMVGYQDASFGTTKRHVTPQRSSSSRCSHLNHISVNNGIETTYDEHDVVRDNDSRLETRRC